MSSLICLEAMDLCRGILDPVIYADSRVMENLLILEQKTMIHFNYFEKVQTDINSDMRNIVITWMMEVCEELKCEVAVLPLAVRLLDRYLCKVDTRRTELQLTGAVCLLIASKVRQAAPIDSETLIFYSDNSIKPEDMRMGEQMVLLSLQWEVTPVTSADFVEHVLSRVPWSAENPLLRRHAHLLAQLCAADHDSYRLRASELASGCVLAAARGLRIPSLGSVEQHLVQLTRVTAESMHGVEQRVEALVHEEELRSAARKPLATPGTPPLKAAPASTSAVQGNYLEAGLEEDNLMDTFPETPTDVLDVHF